MPIHDWLRVDSGIFHHFHQRWMGHIARVLNDGLLPGDYYALTEQFAAGFGPDVLTLQGSGNGDATDGSKPPSAGNVMLAAPKLLPVAETDMAFYRKKQNALMVRHVSDDRVVAVVEIVSPGNKAARRPFQAFLQKATDLIEAGIHLMVIDVLPPTRRDAEGIHAAIWNAISGEEPTLPKNTPLTFASYECGKTVRAYVLHAAVGDLLPEVPLFLEPRQAVSVPLEATYDAAFAEVPHRWQRVLN